METDYLEDWKEHFQLTKWKYALHEDQYYKNIPYIHEEIKSFFPQKDFYKSSNNTDNWLLHLLANKKLFSIQLVTTIAELLRYYKGLDSRESYKIVLKNGLINYREFNEKIFEILVNYILRKVGLTPIINTYYLDRKNNKKEIDICVLLNECSYNVEVTKFYDSFSDKIYDLGLTLKRLVERKDLRKEIRLDELFIGYVAFKKADDDLFGLVKEQLKTKIKEYSHAFKSGSKLIKSISIKDEDYELIIEPSYSTSLSKYKEHLEKFPYFLEFEFVPKDFHNNRAIFSIRGQTSNTNQYKNDALLEKINKKIFQHRDYPNNLLIAIEIDNILTSHSKGIIPAIRYEEVNINFIRENLNPANVVLLIFKEATENTLSMRYIAIGNWDYHRELVQYLQKIDLNIHYNPTSENIVSI